MSPSNEPPIWSHCNECGQETKHDVVHRAERRRTHGDDTYSIDVGSTWNVLQCRGCEEVALRRVDWHSEDDGNHEPTTYFPPRVSRRKPAWADRSNIPSEYSGLLDEVYTSLHADSRRLAMMGARALVDAVILRNVGDQRDFKQGLNALSEKYFIGVEDRRIVEAAVDVGHASSHRGHQPTPDDVDIVIDIVERLIHTEILATQAEELRKTTPSRPSRVKPNKNTE